MTPSDTPSPASLAKINTDRYGTESRFTFFAEYKNNIFYM